MVVWWFYFICERCGYEVVGGGDIEVVVGGVWRCCVWVGLLCG